jgi:hypothetical protein
MLNFPFTVSRGRPVDGAGDFESPIERMGLPCSGWRLVLERSKCTQPDESADVRIGA